MRSRTHPRSTRRGRRARGDWPGLAAGLVRHRHTPRVAHRASGTACVAHPRCTEKTRKRCVPANARVADEARWRGPSRREAAQGRTRCGREPLGCLHTTGGELSALAPAAKSVLHRVRAAWRGRSRARWSATAFERWPQARTGSNVSVADSIGLPPCQRSLHWPALEEAEMARALRPPASSCGACLRARALGICVSITHDEAMVTS